MALQKQKGPAEAATSPSHGSNIPHEETKMNKVIDNTASQTKPVNLSEISGTLLDVANMLDMVKNMNECLFMACSDVGDRSKMNALHSVIDEIDNRIDIISDHLEGVRRAVA